jgi:hypothetical protein
MLLCERSEIRGLIEKCDLVDISTSEADRRNT